MSTKNASALAGKFAEIVGKDNVMTSENDRYAYSYDSAVLDPVMPGLVVRPTSSEALGRVVALCNEHGLPLTVRGAGTNLSGGTSLRMILSKTARVPSEATIRPCRL